LRLGNVAWKKALAIAMSRKACFQLRIHEKPFVSRSLPGHPAVGGWGRAGSSQHFPSLPRQGRETGRNVWMKGQTGKRHKEK